jgi:hypothetical protein
MRASTLLQRNNLVDPKYKAQRSYRSNDMHDSPSNRAVKIIQPLKIIAVKGKDFVRNIRRTSSILGSPNNKLVKSYNSINFKQEE